VLYSFVILLIGFVGFTSFLQDNNPGAGDDIQPLYWLTGVLFALTSFFVIVTVNSSLASGGSFFTMPDVNLLFVSPVNPRPILFYGITRLMKSSFIAAVFILYQASTLKTLWGINYAGVWYLMLAYMVCIFTMSVLSVIIYIWSNGNGKRKKIVRLILGLFYAPLIILFLTGLGSASGGFAAALASVCRSPWLSAVPLAGWCAQSVVSVVSGDMAAGLLFLGFNFVTVAVSLLYIAFGKADYYEDVLVATETAFEKKRALQEGNINAVNAPARKIKVAATGIDGSGANTFLYKHLRETLRESRFGLIGLSTVILTAVSVIAALVFKERASLWMFVGFMLYVQMLKAGTGRGLKELYTHYIYMVPAPPFAKVVWSNFEIAVKAVIEAVFIFTPAGVIIGAGWAAILCGIITYALFTLFVLGVNLMTMRFTGPDISPMVMLMLYIFGMIVLMLPGVIPAIAVGVVVGGGGGEIAALLIVSGWEALCAGVCFFVSREILHNCDMPVMKVAE
ncbi:MAG: putative ABC exporter domain-containing protein, partial [Clostridiales bacterium]|jgi:hypothetical protein|nr:putative ABC exporter domain-containing protein [Clostridiales bacterium]